MGSMLQKDFQAINQNSAQINLNTLQLNLPSNRAMQLLSAGLFSPPESCW